MAWVHGPLPPGCCTVTLPAASSMRDASDGDFLGGGSPHPARRTDDASDRARQGTTRRRSMTPSGFVRRGPGTTDA